MRAFTSTGLTTGVVHAPALGHALAAIASAALIALALVATWRRRPDHGSGPAEQSAPAFAAWACLAVLVNPLAWPHNVLLLLLPAALLAREPTASPRRRRAVGLALVLVTIPYEALTAWAGGKLPLPAATSWLLGVHALGGLLLFATAIRASARGAAEAGVSAGSLRESS